MNMVTVKRTSDNGNMLQAYIDFAANLHLFDTNGCQFLWFFITSVQFMFELNYKT